jgi:low temperature requirement protein LtrA
MIKFLGICKLVFCFIVAIAFLIVLVGYEHLTRRDVIGFAIVLVVVAIYIYYISATAIWNLNANVYKTNILLLLGVLLHFVLIAVMVYETISEDGLKYKISSTLLIILAIIAGAYDISKFGEAWKARKLSN